MALPTESARYLMLSVCIKLSPTGVIQQGFTTLHNELDKEYPTPEETAIVVERLCGALTDGLRYGNWPVPMPVQKATLKG